MERNSVSVEDMFKKYEEAGFLYPEKMVRLATRIQPIAENWRKSLVMADKIHSLWLCRWETTGAWGSVSSWRHTKSTWTTQHLVSTGGPNIWGALVNETQLNALGDGAHASHQCWFRRSNRFANRMFGGLCDALGTERAWSGDYCLFETPFATYAHRACRSAEPAEAFEFASRNRSAIFARSEQLLDADLELYELDAIYHECGLSRRRHVIMVPESGNGEALAMAIAYTGPLGFNFSFLENRCDLILRRGIGEEQAREAAAALLSATSPLYANSGLDAMVVTCDMDHESLIAGLGGRLVRHYAQSIWMRDGYEDACRHFTMLQVEALAKTSTSAKGIYTP